MSQQGEQEAREAELVEAVRESFAQTPDARLQFVLESLVRHLHGFLRETRLTEEEWRAGIDFLTAAGHITDDRRQEFVLLSDVLGVSMQTIAINNEAYDDATEATVLGSVLRRGCAGGRARRRHQLRGARGAVLGRGQRLRHRRHRRLPGALLEVWECDEDGFYDVQYEGDRTAARGRLRADDDGQFRFWALTPVPYPIPHDGPVGQAARRHRALTDAGAAPALPGQRAGEPDADHAHLRRGRGPANGGDAVFGVKESLVREFARQPVGTPTPDGRELG